MFQKIMHGHGVNVFEIVKHTLCICMLLLFNRKGISALKVLIVILQLIFWTFESIYWRAHLLVI